MQRPESRLETPESSIIMLLIHKRVTYLLAVECIVYSTYYIGLVFDNMAIGV